MSKKDKLKNNSTSEVKASLKYVRVSPFKLRKVVNEIRNLDVNLALNKLYLMNQKSARIVYKLLYSCMSNATNNFNLDKDQLLISKVFVNEGPKMKRYQPRARGRMFQILKPTSHLDIFLVTKGESNGSKS